MNEFIVMLCFVAIAIVFGPWVAIWLQGSRLRQLEDRVGRLSHAVTSGVTSPPPRRTALADVTSQLRRQREQLPSVDESLDMTVPDEFGVSDREEPSQSVDEQLSLETADKVVKSDVERDAAPVVPAEEVSPWLEIEPPRPPARTKEEQDAHQELLAVRVMTWAGVVTLVLGVGFLYRYALAQGWVSDTSRVVGGMLAGVVGFAGAVYGRRKEYVFFADCLAAASSGIIKLSIYAATVWYGMISVGTGFRGFLIGGAALWAYAVFFRSRLAASLATVAALLTPALLPDYVGPTVQANVHVFAGYLFVVNLTVVAVTWMRGWRLPAGIATLGTGLHLAVWYANAFASIELSTALAWLAGFTTLFLCHAIVAPSKTRAEHPLDAPILLAGAMFLSSAAVGVTADADYWTKALTTSALSASYMAVWLGLGRRLAGQLPDAFMATVAFLTAATVPFWLSPAWTLVSWAVLAWAWGRLAIRKDRPAAGVVATVLFGSVQMLTAILVISTVVRANAMPLPLWDWSVGTSLADQLKGLFKTTQVGDVGPLNTIFHARSLSVLACFGMSLALWREAQQRQAFERITVRPESLTKKLGLFVVSNATTLSLSEMTHAAVRNEWNLSVGISVWLLHFAALAAFYVWRCSLAPSASDRASTAKTLLNIAKTAGVIAVVTVIIEAMARSSRIETLLPIVNLRSLFFGIAAGALIAVARVLRPVEEHSLWNDVRRSTRSAGVMLLILWGIAETVQFGKWSNLSAEEISALLTLILGLAGVATLAVGFLKLDVGSRRTGLILLALATAKIYVIDIWTASSEVRTIAFIVLGCLLLGAAFLYRRFRDQFKEWLGDGQDVLR